MCQAHGWPLLLGSGLVGSWVYIREFHFLQVGGWNALTSLYSMLIGLLLMNLSSAVFWADTMKEMVSFVGYLLVPGSWSSLFGVWGYDSMIPNLLYKRQTLYTVFQMDWKFTCHPITKCTVLDYLRKWSSPCVDVWCHLITVLLTYVHRGRLCSSCPCGIIL